MFDLVPHEEPVEGELLDAEQDCQLAYGPYCTNTDVSLVGDSYEADVHSNPGQLIRACAACLHELAGDI